MEDVLHILVNQVADLDERDLLTPDDSAARRHLPDPDDPAWPGHRTAVSK